MATTAGFTTDSIARWPLFLPVLLLCSAFIGGCAGSTGGGLKVIRILLLFKQGNRELKRWSIRMRFTVSNWVTVRCRSEFLKPYGDSLCLCAGLYYQYAGDYCDRC
ncbi:potassium transporter TrkG [Citrobacter portucalensis]|uniref:potassium transporter TrkG n=1 Tax=Citrobacter portucalensis TaxID=1639133 RepID=UPI00399052DA